MYDFYLQKPLDYAILVQIADWCRETLHDGQWSWNAAWKNPCFTVYDQTAAVYFKLRWSDLLDSVIEIRIDSEAKLDVIRAVRSDAKI